MDHTTPRLPKINADSVPACPQCGSDLILTIRYVGSTERLITQMSRDDDTEETYLIIAEQEPLSDDLIEVLDEHVQCSKMECFYTLPHGTVNDIAI